MTCARKCAALAIVAVAVSGCGDYTGLGPFSGGFGGGDGGSGGCSLSGGGCGPSPFASPGNVRMLRGDTVRFVACTNGYRCGGADDTGNVLAFWTLPHDSVAVILKPGTIEALDDSATSVLLRAAAPGSVILKAAFAQKGTQSINVIVADSAAITDIDLFSYATLPYALLVDSTTSLSVRLKDAAGNLYVGWPTAVSVSDTTILALRIAADVDKRAKLEVRGLKAGQAELRVQFLDVTRVARLTVLP